MANIVVDYPPVVEQALREKARRRGESVESYLRQLAERELERPASIDEIQPTAPTTFAELARPFSEAVEATGMSEEEVCDFFDDVLREVRVDRRKTRNDNQ